MEPVVKNRTGLILHMLRSEPAPPKQHRLRRLEALRRGVACALAVLVLLAVQPAQAATSLIWDADGTPPYGGAGTWDTTSPYWYNSSTPGYQPWVNANNDDAVFGTSGGTVSLGTGITVHNLTFDTTGYLIQSDTLTLAGTTPTITANANAAISSVIAGSAGLTKTGAGTLTLSGANTTTGGVTLGAGTLNINHAQALGTGTFIISGGKIDNTSGAAITNTNNNPIGLNADFTFTGTQALNLGTGAASLGTAAGTTRTVTVAANTLTIGGAISNGTSAYSLTKSGAGTLTLSGNNTLTGAVTVEGGGTLNLDGTNTFTGTTNVGATSAGNTLNITGHLTGANNATWFNVGRSPFGNNHVVVSGVGNSGNPTVRLGGDNVSVWVGGETSASSNNSLRIENGAYFRHNGGNGTTNSSIGANAGSNYNSLTITGVNSSTGDKSTFSCSGQRVYVGGAGSYNSLTVSAGGQYIGRVLHVGDLAGAKGNTFTITGAGSSLSSSECTFIGGAGGGPNPSDGNSLRIENGGSATIRARSTGRDERALLIGGADGAHNNFVAVKGSGSLLTVTDYGTAAPGDTSTISIGMTGSRIGTTDTLTAAGNHFDVYSGGAATLYIPLLVGGVNSAVNLGDGTGTSSATVYSVSLLNATANLNFNSGKLIAELDNVMVSGPGQVNLLGPAYFSTTFAESSIDSVIAGTGTLTKEESGTLTLSTANTYSGDTKIDAGALKLGNNLAIQNSALDTSGAGALDVTTTNTPMFGGLLGGNNLQMPANVTALTLNPGTGVTKTYSGILGSAMPGMTLTKTGAGTQVLSGANIYSGGTTVSNGTLRVNNTTGSGTGTGAVTVNGGGTLGGTGAISGAVTINAGGRYAPGMSVGTQSVGSLTLAAGSLLDFEFETTSPYTHDLAAVTGTLTLSGGTINLYNAGTTTAFTTNGTYHLFSYGLLSGSTTNLSVDDTSKQYTFGITTGGTKYVNVTIADLNASLLTFPSGTATLLMLKNGSGTPGASTVTNTSAVAGNYAVAGTAGADALTLYPDTGTVDAYGTEDFGFGWASTATSGSRTGAITLTNTSNTSDTGGNKTINVTGVVGNATADMTNSPGAFGTPLTAPVAWGESYANLESQVTGAVGSGGEAPVGSTATILAGINEGFVTPTSPATVSMAWRTRTTTETSLASDVVNLTGMDDGYGQTDYFLLQMTYHPDLLFGDENSLASDGKIYLAWLDTGTTLWTNAGDTATYAVVVGLWSDYVTPGDLSGDLGRWGVNDASHTAWAVVDHNSQFAVVGPEPPIPGDANLDHVVNALDYVVVSNHYGIGSTWAEGDVNGDGVVNALDYVVISNNYGAHAPEPATLALLGLGGLGLILRRKRR